MERVDRLNNEVSELREAHARKPAPTGPNTELSAALGAINLTSQVTSANVEALLDIVTTLASEIDELRRTNS